MKKWYVMEVQNEGSRREAEEIIANSLTQAKRLASRSQVFEGTILYIGLSLDGNGFATDLVAEKKDGHWYELR